MEFIESCSALTLKSYQLDLSQAFKPFKDYQLAGVSAEIWLSWARLAQLSWAQLSPASRNRKTAVLKSYFNYLHQQGITEINLAHQLSCPKVPKKIPHFISVDEMIALLKSFEDSEKNQKLLFLLLYGCGLRISEACHLKSNNLQLQKQIMRIYGKGQRERIVAIPEGLIKLLRQLPLSTIYIWGDKPLEPRTAYNWIRVQGIKAGLIQHLHPHALRHSYATHLLTSGANLRVLQELLGHQSLTATEKYTHLGVDQLARIMERHHPLGDKGK